MLISYIRDENRKPIGTVVALDEDRIGVAMCNPCDRFSKKRGIEIATGRAMLYTRPNIKNIDLNNIVADGIKRMEKRARKYFK